MLKKLLVLLAVFCWSLAAQQTIPLPLPWGGTVMGPDGFIYAGALRSLYKIDPNTIPPSVVWSIPMGEGDAILPGHTCFHPTLGIIVQLGVEASGSNYTDPYRWAVVSLDGSSVKYYLINGTSDFGSGGCAVNANGEIFLGWAMIGKYANKIIKIQPTDLDNVAEEVYSSLYSVRHLVASPDGKTVVGVVGGIQDGLATVGELVVITDTGVSKLPLPFNPIRQPSFSPDGRKFYVSGGNFPSPNSVTGTAEFDTTSWTQTGWSNINPLALAFSGMDSAFLYMMFDNVVVITDLPFNFRQWLFIPDGRSDNKELLVVIRKPLADTLIIRRPDGVLFWDILRSPPSVKAVVDSAGFMPHVSPGSLVSLFGWGMGPDLWAVAPAEKLPTELSQMKVWVQGTGVEKQKLPLLFASPNQINAQLPYGLPTGIDLTFQAEGPGGIVSFSPNDTVTMKLEEASPGLFVADWKTNEGVILDDKFQFISSTRPAKRGFAVNVYATGLGPLAGTASPTSTAIPCLLPVTATVGGIPAQVSWAGTNPITVFYVSGIYVVNVKIPDGVGPGLQKLQVTVNGRASNEVMMAVQ